MLVSKICNRFTGILQQITLNAKEFEALYKTTYKPTIKYILQGPSLNDNELYKVSKHTKQFFLQRMRYSKTTAIDIVFGSPDLGGLCFMNLQMEQGMINVQLHLKALNYNQLVGNVTRSTIRKWKW
jgi:hypothetical protein